MGILCCVRRVQNNKETGMYIDVSILCLHGWETSSLDICRTLFKAEFCNKRGRKDFQQLSQANCCLDSCLGVLGVPKVVPAKFL
jgi:hypothetical protein